MSITDRGISTEEFKLDKAQRVVLYFIKSLKKKERWPFLKDKIIKIFVIGVVLVVLFIEAGLLVSIFASKEFTTVIFSSALVAVLSLGAVCLITFPLFDRILSPMTVLVKKVKGYCGEGHIEEEKGEIAYIDHACSQMISSLGSFSQSNSFLQKFQEILSSGVTTSDLLEAARNGLR